MTYETVSATVLNILKLPAISGLRIFASGRTEVRPYVRSGRAATPGNSAPPRNSSEAPPPVEMCVILSATPAALIAATESPPPMMVVPFTAATALATASVPFANGASFEHTHRSVPHHRLRVGEEPRVEPRAFGADVEAHAIADRRVADLQDFGLRGRIDLVGDDVIDGQLQHDAAGLRVLDDRARRILLVFFDQRLADRHAERLEERVGHRAADQQAIDAAEHALDHLDLVGDLGAADDRDERTFGIAERHAEIAQLFLHQQTGARGLDVRHHARDRCVSAMRRAKRIVNVDVGELGKRLRKRRIVLFFLSVKAQVLEERRPWSPSAPRRSRTSPVRRCNRRQTPPSASATGSSRSATGFRLNSGVGLPFGRPRCDARITVAP